MPIHSQNILSLLLTLLLLATVLVVQAASRSDDELLEAGEYRSGLEEVVVRGQQPAWREQKPASDQQWRPEKFELPESENKGRIEFFPKYTKDERDQYNGVRDRVGEKPEIKLFEWKF